MFFQISGVEADEVVQASTGRPPEDGLADPNRPVGEESLRAEVRRIAGHLAVALSLESVK